MSKTLSISIMKKEFQVACPDGEEEALQRAARYLSEQMEDIRKGDVGAILGWGFAPWSRGPFSWLDIVGAAWAADTCDALTVKYGDRFKTPSMLRRMAEDGTAFYGDTAQQAA